MLNSDYSYKILVIEDNPGDFILIKDHLLDQKVKCRIERAEKWADAKKMLSGPGQNFDVIFLDLTLPDKSGEELIDDSLQIADPVPVIVLTGYTNMEFSVKSLSMGVSDYLLKDELSSNGLWKSILYSIERNTSQKRLEESERRYRDLFKNNPSPMLIWDIKNRNIIDCNEEALLKYGYIRDEFLNLKVDDIEAIQLSESDRENPNALNNDQLWVHKKRNGKLMYMEVNGHLLEYRGRKSVLMLLNDVTERVMLQERIIENTIQAEEQERNRIAKELHDGIVQQLVACGMYVQNLLDVMDDPEQLEIKVKKLYELLKMTTNDTRDLSHKLRSAEIHDMNFSEMVNQLGRQLNYNSGIEFIVKDFLPEQNKLSTQTRINLYRSIQELCNNIVKHSHADEAVITLEQVDDKIFLSITDNGVGFEQNGHENTGIGIVNVKSRIRQLGGQIRFHRMNKGGMKINIEIPL